MRILSILLKKEFRQIFRDTAILRIAIIMPIMQFLILPQAASYEIKNINLVVVDHDHSSYSRQMISQIVGSGYFRLVANADSYRDAYTYIETDRADLLLEIPAHFERDLIREGNQKLLLAVNAINGTKAGLGGNYMGRILADFNRDIQLELLPGNAAAGIDIATTAWFNSDYNYKLFLIPGILAILLTMIGGFLAALNIVREKEIGTIEQINVSPVSKRDFILGKLIPFWILGVVVFTNGLILGYLIYDIVPQGNLLLLYFFVAVYLFAILGFGLLVSTFCDTQQQAMLIMFFFMMVFTLMSGLFTPIESMPEWAQWITHLNPVKYLIQVVRMVMLKGSSLPDMLPQLGAIAGMAVVLNGWAVWNYRKTK
jgi:ABC-2 type transport system permease protein